MKTSGKQSPGDRWAPTIEVLFALDAVRQTGWTAVGRLQMQKLAYLVEVLAPLRGLLAAYRSFSYGHNGPYAWRVQATLDNLVVSGLVEVKDYVVVSSRNQERAKYCISSDGTELANSLRECYSKHRRQFAWVQAIVAMVDLFGLDRILQIVYQEPTFKALRLAQKRGQPIPIDSPRNATLWLWATMERAAALAGHENVSDIEFLWLFFRTLAAYDNQESAQSEGGA